MIITGSFSSHSFLPRHLIPLTFYFTDGQKMINGFWDNTARQRGLKAGKEIEEARGVRKETVILVVVSRDGRWVLTGGGSRYLAELKACEVETGIVKTFEGHSDWITCIDISADNTRLVSGSLDKTGWIWSSEAGRLVAGPFESVDKVGMVRFSPNSKKLAVKSDWATCLEVCRDVESQKLEIRLGIARMATIFAPSPVFWDNNRSAIDTKRIIPKQTGLRPAGPVISECN
jgi:hypothetical protein